MLTELFHAQTAGIGTYGVRGALARTDFLVRIRTKIEEIVDLMFGTSLSEHVLGGYKFLMRYYAPGDEVYIFGFSRGAYTARILAEMLDDVGLLPHGNEEMVDFAWNIFSNWQCRLGYGSKPSDDPKDRAKEARWWTLDGYRRRRHRARYDAAMKLGQIKHGFYTTFSRDMKPIRFLGLFDTVNSVPQFEIPFISRASSKKALPFTPHTSSQEIWHAVSIDERRIKFRPDLLYQSPLAEEKDPHQLGGVPAAQRHHGKHRRRDVEEEPLSPESHEQHDHEIKAEHQRVTEAWFAGNHGDVGGGWHAPPKHAMSHSDAPLIWMVLAAKRAGVEFEPKMLHDMFERNIYNQIMATNNDSNIEGLSILPVSSEDASMSDTKHAESRYLGMLKRDIHDMLRRGEDVRWYNKLSWASIEFIPFRRLVWDEDSRRWGSTWFPPSWGSHRDIPEGAKIHASVWNRMRDNPKYRPRHLIQNKKPPRWFLYRKRSPVHFNPDDWEVVQSADGQVVDDRNLLYIKKSAQKSKEAQKKQ
ncbi:hypothetical protein BX600DRAFT_32641 [Xylariales sp. PMI_506]|nr:hypothetical protein BX600DRAFT_32641 [Xylariales sp. PMI_506]